MKNFRSLTSNLLFLFILLTSSIVFTSCEPESSWFDDDIEDTVDNNGPGNEWGNGPVVDPNNPNDVAGNSTVNNGNGSGNETNGNPPSTTTNVQQPARIWGHQSSVDASPDQVIFLPFSFEVSSHADRITDIYVQITGANTYWHIAEYSGAYNGQIMLSVKIPSRMQTPGQFRVNYRIKDDMGIVSNVLETVVNVVEIGDCSNIYFSGEAGLTVRSFNLGENPGRVRITFDTKSIPDRVDVFYGGKWMHGTGSPISYGQAPPTSDCDQPADGYVGSSGFWDINYDPSVSRRLDVYVAGCFGGGTFWELWVECPE